MKPALFDALASPGGGIAVLLLVFGVGVMLILKGKHVTGAELMGSAVAALIYLILHK